MNAEVVLRHEGQITAETGTKKNNLPLSELSSNKALIVILILQICFM